MNLAMISVSAEAHVIAAVAAPAALIVTAPVSDLLAGLAGRLIAAPAAPPRPDVSMSSSNSLFRGNINFLYTTFIYRVLR